MTDAAVPTSATRAKTTLAQLNLCRRDPELRAQFAFISASTKADAQFLAHAKQPARKMFSDLTSGASTKDGFFGTAWIQNDDLHLQSDKELPGVEKKVLAALKQLGFKVREVICVRPSAMGAEEPVALGPAESPSSVSRTDDDLDALKADAAASASARIRDAVSSWDATRARSVGQLELLFKPLQAHADQEFAQIGQMIETIVKEFPAGLSDALKALADAKRSGAADEVAAKKRVAQELRLVTQFIGAHVRGLKNCESNPFGIPVEVLGPLSQAIRNIQSALQTP